MPHEGDRPTPPRSEGEEPRLGRTVGADPSAAVDFDPALAAAVNDALVGELDEGLAVDPSTTFGEERRLFAALYIRHRHGLGQHVWRYLSDQRDVDEVVQETFLRLFLALPELDSEAQAVVWCRRTATNLCIDRYRSARRRPRLVDIDAVSDELAAVAEPVDPLIQAEDAAIVRHALSLLSPLHRAALVKREIEEKPLPQIAAELDIPEESVKHVLYRARRALRRLLIGTSVAPGPESGSAARRAGVAGTLVLALIVALAGRDHLPFSSTPVSAPSGPAAALAPRSPLGPDRGVASPPVPSVPSGPSRPADSAVPAAPGPGQAAAGTADRPPLAAAPQRPAEIARELTSSSSEAAEPAAPAVPAVAAAASDAENAAVEVAGDQSLAAADAAASGDQTVLPPADGINSDDVAQQIVLAPDETAAPPPIESGSRTAQAAYLLSSPRQAPVEARVDGGPVTRTGTGESSAVSRFAAPVDGGELVLDQTAFLASDGSVRLEVSVTPPPTVPALAGTLSSRTEVDRPADGSVRFVFTLSAVPPLSPAVERRGVRFLSIATGPVLRAEIVYSEDLSHVLSQRVDLS